MGWADCDYTRRLVTGRVTKIMVLVVLVISACKLPSPTATHTPSPTTQVELAWTIIPILIVYPFVQRHFSKGVLIGAVKG